MMLAEIIVGCATAVVLGSLALANAIDRRWYEPEAKNKLRPYEYPSVSQLCPLCGVRSSVDYPQYGPHMPVACKDEDCPAMPAAHLHQTCGYCKGEWMMKARVE